MKAILLSAALLFVIPGGAAHGDEVRRITVELKDTRGQPVGTATLREQDVVTIDLDLRNLPPGVHGLHFHERASCEPPGFQSAGGHFNPGSTRHGTHGTGGPHAGDLPNITVGADGRVRTSLCTDRVTLARGERSVLRGGGTALVVHAQPDDEKSDPAGNSGARIACGVVRP